MRLHSSVILKVPHCRLVFPGTLNPDLPLRRNEAFSLTDV